MELWSYIVKRTIYCCKRRPLNHPRSVALTFMASEFGRKQKLFTVYPLIVSLAFRGRPSQIYGALVVRIDCAWIAVITGICLEGVIVGLPRRPTRLPLRVERGRVCTTTGYNCHCFALYNLVDVTCNEFQVYRISSKPVCLRGLSI